MVAPAAIDAGTTMEPVMVVLSGPAPMTVTFSRIVKPGKEPGPRVMTSPGAAASIAVWTSPPAESVAAWAVPPTDSAADSASQPR
jgi:hypothetical protein